MDFQTLVDFEKQLSIHRGDFFTRWLGLPLSLPITRLFLRYNISENTATFLMWIVGMTGSIFLAFGATLQVVGLLLVVFHYILDYVDGQLARQRNASSILGSVMDRFSHFSVQMTFFFMLGIGLFQQYNTSLVLIPVAIIIFWNQFRSLISNLPALVFCNELYGYQGTEQQIIHDNYLASLGAEERSVNQKQDQAEPQNTPKKPSWYSNIRVASTSFDFLVMTLLLAAVANNVLISMGFDLHLLLLTICVSAAYYLYNIVDFAILYLLSKRIYEDVNKIEKKITS